jgi:hypothetical protein
VEFGKLQSLVELDFSKCSKLRCLPNSIVDLSQLKTFGLKWCRKLENLPVEFGNFKAWWNYTYLIVQAMMFTWFNCGLVTTKGILIGVVLQIGKFTSGVRKTSKLGGTGFIRLLQVGLLTWFNCGLVTTQDILIRVVPQIGKSTSGVWKTLKFGGTGFIRLLQVGLFT